MFSVNCESEHEKWFRSDTEGGSFHGFNISTDSISLKGIKKVTETSPTENQGSPLT